MDIPNTLLVKIPKDRLPHFNLSYEKQLKTQPSLIWKQILLLGIKENKSPISAFLATWNHLQSWAHVLCSYQYYLKIFLFD